MRLRRTLAGGLQPMIARRCDMKILLATDGSDCSKAAVNAVAERPWPEGSEVRIVSGKASGLEIITKIISGSAREVILDEAERWDADLIVLGSHGYNGWQRFLLGSVSHAVATHAHCSVEIVRQKPVTKK